MNEDTPTMLSLADILKNINISLRAFPQPYIIIKSELYKYFHPRNFETAPEQVKKKSLVSSSPKTESPKPTDETLKTESSVKESSPADPAPKVTQEQVVTEETSE